MEDPSTRRRATKQAKDPVSRQRNLEDSADTDLKRLVRLFLLWKLLLISIACFSPGPGYDTSTDILLSKAIFPPLAWPTSIANHIALRMARWDALYFVSSSVRGHLHEQDWAFSWLFSRTIAFLTRGLFPSHTASVLIHAIIGIVVAHLSHFFATIILYYLVYQVIPGSHKSRYHVAFTTAALFILSPAGIFLSAPYAESSFALFNFAGMLCYTLSAQRRFSSSKGSHSQDAVWTVAAGGCFALASTLRGNGLFSGIPFAWDAISLSIKLAKRPSDYQTACRLFFTVLAGSIIACGFAAPQAVAYAEYCAQGSPRPWCYSFPPSIYTFVQSHYWNVGFLRYWTISNLPLFLLAAPVSWIMFVSGFASLLTSRNLLQKLSSRPEQKDPNAAVFLHVIPRFALVQVVLVILAITSFHCQIINRISSGYPLWYVYVAIEAYAPKSVQTTTKWWTRLTRISARHTVKGFVLYAMIQASLYAAFLPPA